MWIRTGDRGRSHDLFLSVIWRGTVNMWCCLDQTLCYVDWKVCDRNLSRPIWSNMWNITDDRRRCHDLIWGAF
jgi:hypothetical protein